MPAHYRSTPRIYLGDNVASSNPEKVFILPSTGTETPLVRSRCGDDERKDHNDGKPVTRE